MNEEKLPWEEESTPTSASFEMIVSFLTDQYAAKTKDKSSFGKTTVEINWEKGVAKFVSMRNEETIKN